MTELSLALAKCVFYHFVLQAEGGLGDILQLDILLKALGFSQMKADSEV